jgi:hypothetical protein
VDSVEQGERVEAELDRIIERRDDERRKTEGECRAEDLWRESVRRYNARQSEDLRTAWREHWRKMRAVHWGLASDYDRKLRESENGHHEEGQHDH